MERESYPQTLRVDVTQEDIDKGVRGSATNCPLARALHRDGYYCEVGEETYIRATENEFGREYLPGGSARDFIEDFDDDERVYPGPFFFYRSMW